jgi:hypothetical protein
MVAGFAFPRDLAAVELDPQLIFALFGVVADPPAKIHCHEGRA